MFYQIFHSPQVKRWAIITYKHDIYELPDDLRLRILGNFRKVSKIHRIIAQCLAPRRKKPLPALAKKPRIAIKPPPLCATPHKN